MKRKFRIIGSFIQNCYAPVKSSRRYNRRSVADIIIILLSAHKIIVFIPSKSLNLLITLDCWKMCTNVCVINSQLNDARYIFFTSNPRTC